MRRVQAGALLTVLLLVVVGCSSPPPLSTERAAILAIEGTASVSRDSWRQKLPASVGMALYQGDVLEPKGRVVVLCPGPTVRTLTTAQTPCLQERSPGNYQGWLFLGADRGGSQPQDVPYVLSPRATLLLSPQPAVRWNATGAVSYTVQIAPTWRRPLAMSGATAADYPASEDPLQPGTSHEVLVVAYPSGSNSSRDAPFAITFRVASKKLQDQARDLFSDLDNEIARANASHTAHDLARALITSEIVEDGLHAYSEALVLAEASAQQLPSAALYNYIGNLQQATLLPREAEASHRTALQLARASGDLLAAAEAHAGIWRATGDKAAYNEALRILEQELNATAWAKKLQEESLSR